MAAELRWILGALSALLLAGIWWWGTRRSAQAPGNPELRESTPGVSAAPVRAAPVSDDGADFAERDWGPSPFEPLSIRTATFEETPVDDLVMTAHAVPLDEHADRVSNRESTVPTLTVAVVAARPTLEGSRSAPTPAEPQPAAPQPVAPRPAAPNASEAQRIVSIRVCAAGDARWSGLELMSTLEHLGLAFGRYNVFHRKHSDGRTLFCAASLVEPGTFNLAKMPHEDYPGLTLFAVLPGPLEPLQTFDALLDSAGQLAQMLNGTIQDAAGLPLSAHRAAALREDIERFQELLSVH